MIFVKVACKHTQETHSKLWATPACEGTEMMPIGSSVVTLTAIKILGTKKDAAISDGTSLGGTMCKA